MRVIEPEGALLRAIEHVLDARQRRDDALHLADQAGLGDIDVRDLVIGDREGARLRHVEHFAAVLDAARRAGRLRAARD